MVPGSGGSGNEEFIFNGSVLQEFEFCKVKEVLEMMADNNVNVLSVPELYTLKWLR